MVFRTSVALQAHEKLAEAFDGSVATKFTVQFTLFGGTVLRLGSEEHRRELPDKIDSAQVRLVFYMQNVLLVRLWVVSV